MNALGKWISSHAPSMWKLVADLSYEKMKEGESFCGDACYHWICQSDDYQRDWVEPSIKRRAETIGYFNWLMKQNE